MLLQLAADLPGPLLLRFIRRGRVYFPKHPLNRDASVPFFHAPVAERWKARFTSSRTLAVVPEPGEPAFSVKLPTDHPHPDFVQPEKTQLRQEAEDAIRLAALIHRVDEALGPEPELRIVKEAITVLVPGSDSGFVVRDLRPLQDGCYYLPALSIPWVGRQIASLHGERFDLFWGRHYACGGRARQGALPGALRPAVRDAEPAEHPGPARRARCVRRARMVLRDLGDARVADGRGRRVRQSLGAARAQPATRDRQLVLGVRRRRRAQRAASRRWRAGTRCTTAPTPARSWSSSSCPLRWRARRAPRRSRRSTRCCTANAGLAQAQRAFARRAGYA